MLEIPDAPLNNGISKSNRMSIESEEEDVSDAAVSLRHTRAEGRERARYMRKRRARRDTQEHNSHHEQPPLPAPTPPPSVRVPDPTLHETVRPYTPRQFPLGDAAYQHMVAAMPDGFHSPASPPPADSDTSSLSPADVTPFDGDDPDDAEWDPRPHRSDRRKSSFR